MIENSNDMKKAQNNNYARFYALTKHIPGDREEIKETLVKTFTKGRTISLREMTREEYRRMCDSLPDSRPSKQGMTQEEYTAEIKKARSVVLKRIQQLGVDTSEWANIDNFCLNTRIAGKVFRALSLDELKRLVPKLAAIAGKPHPAAQPDTVSPVFISHVMQLTKNQIPS